MKKFTIDQIIKILAQANTPGNSIAATARKYGISEKTIYRWRKNTVISPHQKLNTEKHLRQWKKFCVKVKFGKL